MPEPEGLLLYEAGLRAGRLGPLVEIGAYCGKSTVFLGAAARETGTVVLSVDHHRGSEEHQPGQEYHDPRLVDPATGKVDTLGAFRRTMAEAGLEEHVVAVVGASSLVASVWGSPLGLVFIDGGHSEPAVQADYEGWAPWLVPHGLLVFDDIYPDPAEGGQAPLRVFDRALASGQFVETGAPGRMRVLERVAGDLGRIPGPGGSAGSQA